MCAMKIVYLYRGVPVSTPLMHIRFMMEAFRRLGHEVTACFPVSEGPASVSAVVDDRRVRRAAWFRAWMPRPLVNLAQMREARRARQRVMTFCQEARPDFIYERYSVFTDAGLRAARAVSCPIIWEMNSVYSVLHPEVFSPWFRWLARRSDARLTRMADALIAVSGEVAGVLRGFGVSEDKITVMHNAVHPPEYEGLEARREARRRELGIGDSLVVVLLQALDAGPFPARLLQAVHTAWPRIRAAVPGARLLWIGGGSRLPWFRERLRQTLPTADSEIVLLGSRAHAEVPELLACGDIGLVPWHRPFCSPMKIFEYMATGLPLVAPDLAGIREVVRHRENGLLFAHDDFARMAEAVVELATNQGLARELGRRGREYVLRKHTWDGNAAAVIEIARALIAQKEGWAGS